MTNVLPDGEKLLWGREVAAIMRVEQRSVARWRRQGKLRAVRLPGGHYRYFQSDVDALLNSEKERDNGQQR